MSRTVRDGLLLGLALLAAACVLPRVGLWWGEPDGNLTLFRDYGERIAGGAVPYRDLRVEYPPGALAAIVLPALLPLGYATAFKLLAALLAGVTIWLAALLLERLGLGRGRVLAGAAFVPLALLAAGPLALQRFDLLPAALTLGALVLLLDDRPRLAFALLALGALAKIYPLAVVPVALAYVWRTRGRGEALRGAALTAAIGAVVVLPFAAIDHVGFYLSLAQQANRHLQLETLGSSALLVAHRLGSYDPHVVFDAGAYTLAGRTADAVARVQTGLQALGLLAVWIAFARLRRPSPAALVLAATAAVAAFAVLGKVLSPQFLLWLVPLVPALPVALAALLAAALVLSHVLYPTLYSELVGLEAAPTWVLVARNALLVIVLVVVARAARGSRRAAGSAATAPTRSR